MSTQQALGEIDTNVATDNLTAVKAATTVTKAPLETPDTSLYEIRKYHHNANWTDEARAAYVDWVNNDFLPKAAKNNFNVISFWVKPEDGKSHDTITSGPALLTGGADTNGHETKESFPTAVWMLKWDDKAQRDKMFGSFLGSEEGKACLGRNPFNGPNKQLEGYELIEEHFFENKLSGGMELPSIAGRATKAGLHEIRTYYMPKTKFDESRADPEQDKYYLTWVNALFKTLKGLPEFEGRITSLFLDNSAQDPALVAHNNYVSGPHVLSGGTIDAPKEPELTPKVFWTLHWDSKEQSDAAWGSALTNPDVGAFFAPFDATSKQPTNPFNTTGKMDDYLQMEFQWMQSLV